MNAKMQNPSDKPKVSIVEKLVLRVMRFCTAFGGSILVISAILEYFTRNVSIIWPIISKLIVLLGLGVWGLYLIITASIRFRRFCLTQFIERGPATNAAIQRTTFCVVSIGIFSFFCITVAPDFFPKSHNFFDIEITIKDIFFCVAGVCALIWGIWRTVISTIDSDQKIADGKREKKKNIADSKREEEKNTAQLIMDAAAMLNKSDAEKSAGLIFLNNVADSSDGPFRQEAFDVIMSFCQSDPNTDVDNTTRTEALLKATELYAKYEYKINYAIEIKGDFQKNKDNFTNIFITTKYINIKVRGGIVSGNRILDNVYFCNCNINCNIIIADNVQKAHFCECKINSITIRFEGKARRNYFDFTKCDFSGCKEMLDVPLENLKECYYYSDNKPAAYVLERYGSVFKDPPRDPALRDDKIKIGAQ